MNSIIFFLFVILLQKNQKIFCYRCGADSIKKKPKKIEVKNDDDKRALSTDYTPINIKYDYTYLKVQNKLNSKDLNDLIQIFTDISEYLSSLFSVEHINLDINTKNIKEVCEIPYFSSDIQNSLYTHDLLIFPMINMEMEEEVLAQAWTCLTINSNNRPIAGVVEVNPDFSLSKIDSDYYIKYLLMHEISHVLGFGFSFFQELNFIYTENKDGVIKNYLNSPKVVKRAKLHFNCENIKGVELENQGGSGSAGSHWEARYMLGDYMISTDYPEVTISDITLAYFEDTGFYKVNYYTGGLFRFGKNQGCSFLTENCVKNNGKNTLFPNEFCTETEAEEYFCGSSHISRGDCYIIDYDEKIDKKFRHFTNEYIGGFEAADYCPVSYSYYYEEYEENYFYHYNCNYGLNIFNSMGEIIGENSLCFESSLVPINNHNSLDELFSVCYKVQCDRDKKQVKIYIGNSIITCPKNGGILNNPNGFKGQIKCPNYNIICTSEIWCNELFDCIDKKSVADLNTFYYENYSEDTDDTEDEKKNKSPNISITLGLNKFIFILEFLILFLL